MGEQGAATKEAGTCLRKNPAAAEAVTREEVVVVAVVMEVEVEVLAEGGMEVVVPEAVAVANEDLVNVAAVVASEVEEASEGPLEAPDTVSELLLGWHVHTAHTTAGQTGQSTAHPRARGSDQSLRQAWRTSDHLPFGRPLASAHNTSRSISPRPANALHCVAMGSLDLVKLRHQGSLQTRP